MALELRNIRKRFGSVVANDGISLSIQAGEIHGLLGENGAGKSTLVRVLSGFLTADDGEVVLDGRRLDLRSPRDAIEAGIGILHQEPLVFLPFSAVDNFIAGTTGSLGLPRAEARAALKRVCGEFGFEIDPDAPASTLTVGERQQLEIARLIWLGARVLIFDEPTTAISEAQRQRLFATLRRLAADGMAVIFVSHKLEEVAGLCERVTVLQSGRVSGERTLPCPPEELVALMFGRAVEAGTRPVPVRGTARLRVESLSAGREVATITGVTLEVAQGEVVGLAGLEGAGQRVLLRALAGQIPTTAGRVTLDGRDVTADGYRARMAAGVHHLPADRIGEGLVPGLTITEHIALTAEQSGAAIDWAAAERDAAERIERFSVRGTPDSVPESLSGGNQQRLLLALMPPQPSLVLMEHPTRGLDVESAAWVWRQLLARREDGTAFVFASADLDELMTYCDRILVCFSGRIIGEVDAATTSVAELGLLIGGVTA
ncbi:MAG: ATP-binding cassette domain-containing protein [Chloroflexi bacterium]|nr:ATP-binding cassette domain-containing protein [Chloroflexota bacterium]